MLVHKKEKRNLTTQLTDFLRNGTCASVFKLVLNPLKTHCIPCILQESLCICHKAKYDEKKLFKASFMERINLCQLSELDKQCTESYIFYIFVENPFCATLPILPTPIVAHLQHPQPCYLSPPPLTMLFIPPPL